MDEEFRRIWKEAGVV